MKEPSTFERVFILDIGDMSVIHAALDLYIKGPLQPIEKEKASFIKNRLNEILFTRGE